MLSKAIRFTCPNGGRHLRSKPNLIGKRVRCPKRTCGTIIEVPTPGENHATESSSLHPYLPWLVGAAAGAVFLLIGLSIWLVGDRDGDSSATSDLAPMRVTAESSAHEPVSESVPANRLSSVVKCCENARNQTWGAGLRQIPSTVIDKGVLRHVPYSSFRGGNYEINIYADPVKPSCIEIGIYSDLIGTSSAMRNCFVYIQAILNEPQDRLVVESLNLRQDVRTRAGLTFEVTPVTADDAYGGWWISVYDAQALEQSRASPQELDAITERKDEIRRYVPTMGETSQLPEQSSDASLPTLPTWSPSDLKDARRAPSDTSSSSDRVYVRGYIRKDGTYVRPHSRSRARR